MAGSDHGGHDSDELEGRAPHGLLQCLLHDGSGLLHYMFTTVFTTRWIMFTMVAMTAMNLKESLLNLKVGGFEFARLDCLIYA